jgi:hypothetical protein
VGAIDRVCREGKDQPVAQMATRLVNTFLDAKTKDLKTSLALYSVIAVTTISAEAFVSAMSDIAERL